MHSEDLQTEKRVRALEGHRDDLIVYLKRKVDVGDWHAVADAAMDLREIDAALTELHRSA